MFQTGDKVVYGIHGVCDIVDQEVRQADRKSVTYLVLEPVGQSGSRYLIPTHSAPAIAKLKQLLSREEWQILLQSEEAKSDGWIRDENQRKQLYRELISSGDRPRLIGMVRILYEHKNAQAAAGRKCHMCDENFLRDVEKLLCSELSIVMDMSAEEAKKYLRNNLH